MKKLFTVLVVLLLSVALFAQGSNEAASSNKAAAKLKAGMVTDSGTIDDRSFNQGTWEGVKKAADELGL